MNRLLIRGLQASFFSTILGLAIIARTFAATVQQSEKVAGAGEHCASAIQDLALKIQGQDGTALVATPTEFDLIFSRLGSEEEDHQRAFEALYRVATTQELNPALRPGLEVLSLAPRGELTGNIELLYCGIDAKCKVRDLSPQQAMAASQQAMQFTMHGNFRNLNMLHSKFIRTENKTPSAPEKNIPKVEVRHVFMFSMPPSKKAFKQDIEFLDAFTQWVGQFFREATAYSINKVLVDWINRNIDRMNSDQEVDPLFAKYTRIQNHTIALDNGLFFALNHSVPVKAWAAARKIVYSSHIGHKDKVQLLNAVLPRIDSMHRSGAYKDFLGRVGTVEIVTGEFGMNMGNIFEQGEKLFSELQNYAYGNLSDEFVQSATETQLQPHIRPLVSLANDQSSSLRELGQLELAQSLFWYTFKNLSARVNEMSEGDEKKSFLSVINSFKRKVLENKISFSLHSFDHTWIGIGSTLNSRAQSIQVDSRFPSEIWGSPLRAEGELLAGLFFAAFPEWVDQKIDMRRELLASVRASYWNQFVGTDTSPSAEMMKELIAAWVAKAREKVLEIVQKERDARTAEKVKVVKAPTARELLAATKTTDADLLQINSDLEWLDKVEREEFNQKVKDFIAVNIVTMGEIVLADIKKAQTLWEELKKSPSEFDAKKFEHFRLPLMRAFIFLELAPAALKKVEDTADKRPSDDALNDSYVAASALPKQIHDVLQSLQVTSEASTNSLYEALLRNFVHSLPLLYDDEIRSVGFQDFTFWVLTKYKPQ